MANGARGWTGCAGASILRYWWAPDGRSLEELERHFWARLREKGTVDGEFTAEGVNGMAHLETRDGRIDVNLQLWGDQEHGVMLQYWKRGVGEVYGFAGDSRRLREWIHGPCYETWMPVALSIPPETSDAVHAEDIRDR